MEKVGGKFEKSVELPDTSERIYYKVGTSFVPLCLDLYTCDLAHNAHQFVGWRRRETLFYGAPGPSHIGVVSSAYVRAHARVAITISIVLHRICDAVRWCAIRPLATLRCLRERGTWTRTSPDRLPRVQLASADGELAI